MRTTEESNFPIETLSELDETIEAREGNKDEAEFEMKIVYVFLPSLRLFLQSGQYHLPFGSISNCTHLKWNHLNSQFLLSQPTICPYEGPRHLQNVSPESSLSAGGSCIVAFRTP